MDITIRLTPKLGIFIEKKAANIAMGTTPIPNNSNPMKNPQHP